MPSLPDSPSGASPTDAYYRLHAKVYDATRWSFLFGREWSVKTIAALRPAHVLEAGCGTGRNLQALQKLLPTTRFWGIDSSVDMIDRANKKLGQQTNVQLIQGCYDETQVADMQTEMDVVLFSYALSMFNPGYEAAMKTAISQLRPGGSLVVVDFHDTSQGFFAKWMGVNHVRMEGHLLPLLQDLTEPVECQTHKAYGGLWRYLCYRGVKV